MSGGSYNYLCDAQADDVMSRVETLREMAERLDGVCPEAAAKTREILAIYVELDQRVDGLREIWKAVEWRDSCDWGDDQLAEAVTKYKTLAR
jgi:hypothetical protein